MACFCEVGGKKRGIKAAAFFHSATTAGGVDWTGVGWVEDKASILVSSRHSAALHYPGAVIVQECQ